MKKKGYMFMLDAVLAIMILVVGLVLIYFNFQRSDSTIYFTEQLSEDIVGVLSYTNIKDLCENPGISDPSCNCPNYPELQQVVCDNNRKNVDVSILGLFNELIETGSVAGSEIKDIIREIFVDKKVIDEKRFGFSILYTNPSTGIPLELYNTESP